MSRPAYTSLPTCSALHVDLAGVATRHMLTAFVRWLNVITQEYADGDEDFDSCFDLNLRDFSFPLHAGMPDFLATLKAAGYAYARLIRTDTLCVYVRKDTLPYDWDERQNLLA